MLGMWDAISLIVGIVVGVSIYRAPAQIFSLTGSPAAAIGMWGAGGLLALCGALCYCELSSTYPKFGAEYVYLSRAYGRRVGFLFAWMQCSAVLTGSIGVMAFVFADYSRQAIGMNSASAPQPLTGCLTACGAIAMLVLLQSAGMRTGKLVQNLLTGAKIVSAAAILICGLFLAPELPPDAVSSGGAPINLGLALVFVLYAYGGWNDATSVTPDVRDCQRTMPRALLIALALITILYVLMNLAYVRSLGFAQASQTQTPAADVVGLTFGGYGSRAMSVVIMISALGAIHGMLFAGCRLLAAVGENEPRFRYWNRWSRNGAPLWSLWTLGVISMLLTLIAGTPEGQAAAYGMARALRIAPPASDEFQQGFEALITATAPVFWAFILLAALSVIVLRIRDPHRHRPFRTPGYPFTPIIFAATAGFMCWSAATYAHSRGLIGLSIPALLVGLALSGFGGTPARAAEDESSR